MSDCGFTARRRARRRAEEAVTAAFLQACREFGIAPHPGGDCPSPECPCERLGDAIEARAVELVAAELGIPAAELGSEGDSRGH